MQLDVLARGDVALLQRGKPFGNLGEGVQLIGRNAAERQLHADHLHVGLPLPVDALLEPESDELLFDAPPGQIGLSLGGEVRELLVEDLDHTPGGVFSFSNRHAWPPRAARRGRVLSVPGLSPQAIAPIL